MTDTPDGADAPAAVPNPDRSAAAPRPAAGWYPDPAAPLVQLRFWDGAEWAKERRPLTAPASSAAPLAPPPAPIPSGGGRSTALTLAGILFIVGGIGGTVGALTLPVDMTSLLILVGGYIVLYLGAAGAYAVFWRAGFPHRSRALSVITIIIAASYLVTMVLFVALVFTGDAGLNVAMTVSGGIGGILTIAFTVMAARNRLLPRGFRVVPVAQLLLIWICNIVAFSSGFDATGFVLVGAGAAYVILASNARAALEAASVAPESRRLGQPAPPAVRG